MQRQSRNINHQGIDISRAYNAYADYFFEGKDLNASAQEVAEGIREVVATGKLKAADVEALTDAVAKMVGDAELAEAYVAAAMDVKEESGYNIKKKDGTEKRTDDILDWNAVISKKGETRLDHVNKHSSPKPDRATHGVFNGDPQNIVNMAWKLREEVAPVDDGMGGIIYNIPYKNAGYESGYENTGKQMDFVTIIILDGTNELITAFPSFGLYTK